MDEFRRTLATHPELGSRVDTLVGFEFSATRRPLTRVLTMRLLTPLVEATRSYIFDRAIFDEVYARMEAGLLEQTVQLLHLVPLLGFETALQAPIKLATGLVIRLMDDAELSAALETGLAAEATSTTTSRTVPQTYQRALVKTTSYPTRTGEIAGPVETPTPIDEEGLRLQIALRLVCGGSISLGRPFQMQHPDDFDANRGHSAARTPIEVPDDERPTILYTPEQVTEVDEIMAMLTGHRVVNDRSLQMAIRRLMSAGSRRPAEDRLVDLMVAAEALFIHGAGHGRTRHKKNLIADGAAELLGDDPELRASATDISRFIGGCYIRRNHEVHADPTPPAALRLLDGTLAASLNATVHDLEHLIRRAVTLTITKTSGAARLWP